MELKEVNESLNSYIRPGSFPVAIKMVSSADEIPEKVRMPKRDLGMTMPLCQGIALARRLGWSVAMGEEDMLCPFGALTLGFLPAKPKFLDGTFNLPFWLKDQAARARICQAIPRLEQGEYTHVVIAPLHRANFEPQVIVIYGNPAQVARLIQVATYETGEAIASTSLGAADCAENITTPILTDQCRFIVTGGGTRVIVQTQDHECSFAVPVSKLESVIEGLEKSHKAGQVYPTASFLAYQARFPRVFGELMDYLRQGD
jgi:uncharacterized protein (DUF169 family)